MPKILWLTENYPPQRGGMAQSCDRIIYGLRGVGYEIEIIHFTTKGHDKIHRKQQQNGGYTAIGFEESESHTLNLAWSYIKRLGSFDYIACFGGYLPMIAAPIFAKWKALKLVTFLRGNDFDTSIFVPRKRKILEDALKQSSFVFSVSKDKKFKIKKWLENINIHFVANGIAVQDWDATISENEFAAAWVESNSKGRICFGIFGQLKAKKGIQFLINVLKKTNLASQIHLLLIGDIEDHITTQIEATVLTYTSIAFQDRYELLKYYLCCDAILIPSFYDGMPNVMLEAGALGLPIIGSAVDGIADLIEHGKDGFLFYPGDENECRKAIYDFSNLSKNEQSELGLALKEKIFNFYSTDHETEQYSQLLI